MATRSSALNLFAWVFQNTGSAIRIFSDICVYVIFGGLVFNLFNLQSLAKTWTDWAKKMDTWELEGLSKVWENFKQESQGQGFIYTLGRFLNAVGQMFVNILGVLGEFSTHLFCSGRRFFKLLVRRFVR